MVAQLVEQRPFKPFVVGSIPTHPTKMPRSWRFKFLSAIIHVMQILLPYLKKYWKLIALAMLLAAINQVFSLIDPIIFRHILDDYATKYSQYTFAQFFHGVSLLLAASIGVAFVSRTAKNFQDYFVNTITQKIGARIYSDGLKHSLELPYQVFEDQRSGETLGKLEKVRTDTQNLIQSAINVLFTTLIGFIFVSIYAIRVNWIIAVAYFAIIPIIGTLSYVLSKKIKTIQKKIVAQTNALAGSTTESLRNIELVKSLGLAKQEISRLNNTTSQILDLELSKIKYLRTLSFLQGTIINFLRTALLFVMLYMIFAGKLTFGQFFSLYIYSFFLFNPLQELGNIINTYRESEASLQNFETIMKQPKEPAPEHPEDLGEVKNLDFEDVTFQHLTASNPALQDVTFNTERGQTVAFVGPSGSGKTTLVKLLVGLYQPQKGSIKYNGKDSRQIDLNQLREQIGLVTQDAQLFAGTIRDNLKFVNPHATDEELIDVLNKAAAQSLLARADKGLDTLIGESGIKVSGGEKQRLSIARALLRHPKILVFDEATSALDSLTEEEINKTIRDVSHAKNHITILIAHRLSTVMHADKIYVLEKGKVSESGTHQQLLDQKGLYYAMWRQQIGER
jgi:ATP-binding cassette subfamily B protein